MIRSFNFAGFNISNNLILSPMAGISDFAMRSVSRQQGASFGYGEMSTSQLSLLQRNTSKSISRSVTQMEESPRIVQIVGSDPSELLEAGLFFQEAGADVIDVNFGCPAKKVTNQKAGSTLLNQPKLIQGILENLVKNLKIKVTIKMRTGINPQQKNYLEIAKIAESTGVAAIAIHGRTAADKFLGDAEYTSITNLKNNIKIPVIANGDIDSEDKALEVLKSTASDAIMIGRAACGDPWIFNRILAKAKQTNYNYNYLDVITTMLKHLVLLEAIYTAANKQFNTHLLFRKHFIWYLTKNLAPKFIIEKSNLNLVHEIQHSMLDITQKKSLIANPILKQELSLKNIISLFRKHFNSLNSTKEQKTFLTFLSLL